MTNEEKARELAEMLIGGDRNIEPLVDTLLQAMQWKDEQHTQEKQQLIDVACKWLFVNDSYAIPTNVQVNRLREHLNNIK